MKKRFSLLVAILMIISLAACGGEKKTESNTIPKNNTQVDAEGRITEATKNSAEGLPTEIEITLDNWRDYLEMKYMVGWDYNAFDEIEGYSYIYPVLALKEEYMGGTISSNTELSVEFTATEIWRTASADIESKTYEWGEESGVKEKEEVNDTAKFYAEGLGSNKRILNDGGIVILNPFSKQGKGVVSYPYYENFNITRIEGTIVFE